MKKVRNDVAHVWAHQTQSEATTAGRNFYFNGRTIYSYGSHFPIATISNKDSGTVLFTLRSYSNTTAKHISETRAAVSHKTLLFCFNPVLADQGDHEKNLSYFSDLAQESVKKLERARKPEIYLNEILRYKKMYSNYCTFFKIKENPKKYNFLFVDSVDSGKHANEELNKQLERARKKQELEERKRQKRQLVEDAVKLNAWRINEHGANDYLNLRIMSGTFLRISKDGANIETSKGVKLPINVAKRFYNWFKQTVKSGGCNGECDKKILDYSVNSVSEKGLIVGCHDISTNEIEAIASALNW